MGQRRYNRAHRNGEKLALSALDSFHILHCHDVSTLTARTGLHRRLSLPQTLQESAQGTRAAKLYSKRLDRTPGLFEAAYKSARQASTVAPQLLEMVLVDEDRKTGSHRSDGYTRRRECSGPQMRHRTENR